jgi:toxin ParE1/3/4
MSFPDYRLIVSPQAQLDIASILRYTGNTWGRNQVLVYRDKLDEALKAIGINPNLGYSSPELPETHRLYFVGVHVVVYRMRGNTISVARVLHQRMSLARHFGSKFRA